MCLSDPEMIHEGLGRGLICGVNEVMEVKGQLISCLKPGRPTPGEEAISAIQVMKAGRTEWRGPALASPGDQSLVAFSSPA